MTKQRLAFGALSVSLAFLGGATVFGQVSTINSVNYHPREFNDVPGAILGVVSNAPSLVLFYEGAVSKTNGFANRDVWRFSNNNGATAYKFANNDFFHVSLTLQLTGTPTSPRKEAGFLLSTIGGDGQFIVNTDAHEVVAFGGPLPFFSFGTLGLTYNSGDEIRLGMTYFLDSAGKRAVIYEANGLKSPPLEFTNLEQGIIDNSTLGGYFQIVNDPANPNNTGTAAFSNVSIAPEPSVVALLGVGGLVALLRRRS